MMTFKQEKPVTLQTIATACGVSRMTVSCALRGKSEKVGPQMMERIRQVAQELGYDPSRHHAARRLVSSRSGQNILNNTVSVIFPVEHYAFPYFNTIFQGILGVLEDDDYGVFINSLRSVSAFLNRLPSPFIRGDIDGAILTSPRTDVVEKIRNEVSFAQRPIVTMNFPMPSCSSVLVDDLTGGYLAALHLLDLNHRRILRYECSDLRAYPHCQRVIGQNQACHDRGLAPEDCFVHLEFRTRDKALLENALLKHIREDRITGILAPNDFTAEVITQILENNGIRVPEQISLVGFDDSDPYLAKYVPNKLTTIRVPILEMGQQAARLLIQRITGEQQEDIDIILPVSLIIRETTLPLHG